MDNKVKHWEFRSLLRDLFIGSPLPWRFDGHGINDANGNRIFKSSLARYQSDGHENPTFNSDSEFVVHTVNSYYDLVRTLKNTLRSLKTHLEAEANQEKVKVSELCPCTEDEVTKAEKILKELGEWEEYSG